LLYGNAETAHRENNRKDHNRIIRARQQFYSLEWSSAIHAAFHGLNTRFATTPCPCP
jgi:hypothetical protein